MSRRQRGRPGVEDPDARLQADVETLRRSLPPPPPTVARPFLVLLCGLPGSGKTHLARLLAAETPMQTIESDAARKALVCPPAYNSEENSRVFGACRRLMEELLDSGVPVLLDATNVTERDRSYSCAAADRKGVEVVLVKVTAPERVVKQRLERRQRIQSSDGASDAGWDTYLRMKSRDEPVRRPHYLVDTSRDISTDIRKISRKLKAISRE